MGFQRAAQSLEATTIPLPGNRKRDFFCSIQWEASPPEGEGVSLRMPETNQKHHSQVRSATPSPFPRPWSVAEWAGKRRSWAMTWQEVASNTKKKRGDRSLPKIN